jgi:ribosome-binding protein aMBF1 (putative translation factor)
LYKDLEAAIMPMTADRLEALGELLNMDLETKTRSTKKLSSTIKELSAKLDDGQDIETKLRTAIKASGLTHYAIAKMAAITPDVLDRFVSGQRGLNLSTASKVAAVLGLGLFPIAKRQSKTPSSTKLKISR